MRSFASPSRGIRRALQAASASVLLSAPLVASAQETPSKPEPLAASTTEIGSRTPADPDAPNASERERALGGVELGLRLGIALPMGTAGGTAALSDMASNNVPIWGDIGYRVSDRVMLGLYGQYGVLSPKCGSAATSCSGSDVRVGAQVHVHILPQGPADPWVGAGFGYEWMSFSESSNAGHGDGGVQGFELLNLQGGLDWRVSQAVGIGPFAALSVGQYSTGEVNGRSGDIQQTAIHEWFTLGVRGSVY